MIQKLLTDQALALAAASIRDAMLESLPAEIECQFTPSFEPRMDELRNMRRKREKHRQIRNRVVAATVALFLLASLLLGLNPDVRAAVSTWFKEVFDTYTFYWYSENPVDTFPECVVTAVPDGYEVIIENDTQNTRIVIYQKGSDIADGFSFEYGKLLDDAPLCLSYPTDQFYTKEVTVNGLPGDLYVSLVPSETHGVIWIDEEKGIYYVITAYFDPELIMELAESVEIKK